MAEAAESSQQVAETKVKKRKGAVLFNSALSDYEVVSRSVEERGWRVIRSEEKALQCNVHWIDTAGIQEWLPRVEPWMRINHFPGMNNALARKSRLARNMARMQRSFPKEYNFVPPTWVLPDDFASLEKRFAGEEESKMIYIVKPDHMCQGKGIFLTTELEKLRQMCALSREKDMAVVVQRYIARPMLIEGLKFDLRLYFLVSGVLGEGGEALDPRHFLFRDGLVRLCTTAYEAPTPETLDDKCMHLTNYAINKNSKDFEQPDDGDGSTGSKRSLRWFLNYIEELHGEKERAKLWIKLMGLCVKMLLMVHPTLESEYKCTFPRDLSAGQFGCRCFEVLGVDVMLDVKLKPYLIEVNHLPSFTCDSPLDEDIKYRVVNQVLDLTCRSLTGKDKKAYEDVVRERREAGELAQPGARGRGAPLSQTPPGAVSIRAEPGAAAARAEDAVSLLELESYMDFERAYPPPASAAKLTAQCETILGKVRELFRPVVAGRRPKEPEAPKPPARPGARPPLPPKEGAGAPRPSDGYGSPGDARTGSVKRSRSAPGPPRCALPPIGRGPGGYRAGSRSRSPGQRDSGDGSVDERRGAARRQRSLPPRVYVAMKSVQIGLTI